MFHKKNRFTHLRMYFWKALFVIAFCKAYGPSNQSSEHETDKNENIIKILAIIQIHLVCLLLIYFPSVSFKWPPMLILHI